MLWPLEIFWKDGNITPHVQAANIRDVWTFPSSSQRCCTEKQYFYSQNKESVMNYFFCALLPICAGFAGNWMFSALIK